MKGHFGRQRIDRPHPTVAVDSYETAVYPPRSYRCHTFDFSVEPDQNTVMLPSIDSDSICNPFTKDLQSTNKAQRRPSLREYFFCYVSSSRQKQPSVYPSLEPLNVLHYPELYTFGDVRMGLPSLTKAIAFPAELMPLHAGRGSSVEILTSPEKLKIHSSYRRKPPKPTRRGGTVTVSVSVKSSLLPSQRRKRSRNEDENADDGDEGSDVAEEFDSDNDYEASVGLCDDDDDDVGDGIDSGSEGPFI